MDILSTIKSGLADLIASKRRELLMTQQKFAELSGVSQTRICAIEKGHLDNVTVDYLLTMAQKVGVTISSNVTTCHDGVKLNASVVITAQA